jgi:hypothetical protein
MNTKKDQALTTTAVVTTDTVPMAMGDDPTEATNPEGPFGTRNNPDCKSPRYHHTDNLEWDQKQSKYIKDVNLNHRDEKDAERGPICTRCGQASCTGAAYDNFTSAPADLVCVPCDLCITSLPGVYHGTVNIRSWPSLTIDSDF